jgi:hypothetical protein
MVTVRRAAARLVKEYREKTGGVDLPSIIWSLSYLHPDVNRYEIEKLVLEIVGGSHVSVLESPRSASPRTVDTGSHPKRQVVRIASASR